MWILVRIDWAETEFSPVESFSEVRQAWKGWKFHTNDTDPGNAQRLLEYENISTEVEAGGSYLHYMLQWVAIP